jgi:transketolase
MDLERLSALAGEVRADILRMSHYVGPERKAHPGAALSIADLLVFLHHEAMRPGDRFILSKGHGSLALYAVLASLGLVDKSEYRDVRSIAGRLQGHPVRGGTPGVDATTGSLGHGLALGVGMALAKRLGGASHARIFVVLGDGELQEGLIWESALVAASLGLSQITAIVDRNGYQSSGRVGSISRVEPIAEKFRWFGWHTTTCDGHDFASISGAVLDPAGAESPRVVIAQTVKGSGISFMEGNSWHQRWLDKESLTIALEELGTGD